MRTLSICAGVACALGVAASSLGAIITVGSPVIDRNINQDDSLGLVLIYLGGTQPISGPGMPTTWSFFDDSTGTFGRSVTPLVFEITAAGQYTVAAIGTTRQSNSSGVQEHNFGVIAGITELDPGKQYTFGFTDRAYTQAAPGVAVSGASNGGSVDFTGYNNFTDRWAYAASTTAEIGSVYGTGGSGLDTAGFAGRIYSAAFNVDTIPAPGVVGVLALAGLGAARRRRC